ncbi:unnamed protein product [Cylicostephanus goldi]|uniref:Major sperm protein n=1 Tax=Cylicostephanus goldi TaxID=71465 RepID=A0A3P6REV5_CYLGO|nr:unnamed protein product [Cylicostephanus goldi]
MGDFKLQLEPSDKIIFSGKKLGEEATPASIKITNTLKERIAYKVSSVTECPIGCETVQVKCTSNEMFRIRPPVGALKPDDSVTVSKLCRRCPLEAQKHFYLFAGVVCVFFLCSSELICAACRTAFARRLPAPLSLPKTLTFNAGKTVPDSGKHYFAVYYIKAPDEKKAPRATWADHKGDPEGTKRLYIDFKKEGEEEKKDEKKEGEEKKDEKKDEEKKDEKKDEEKKDEKKDEEKKDEKKDEEKKEEKKDEEKKERNKALSIPGREEVKLSPT